MKSYQAGCGRYQDLYDELVPLIPETGPVPYPRKNRALERFRTASNCYFDLYATGASNHMRKFRELFGLSTNRYRYVKDGVPAFREELYARTEVVFDEIVLKAAIEQNLRE